MYNYWIPTDHCQVFPPVLFFTTYSM
jgi:hypothetical protein